MTLLKAKPKEEPICDIQFNIHSFTNRSRPDKKDILIICCFSEFGCEILGSMYCIPRLKAENPGSYIIVAGWYGRAFLYRHLVDEYWEMKEEFQFLRDSARAFHHSSKNLTKIEKTFEQFGKVVTSDRLGAFAVGNTCNNCRHVWGDLSKIGTCPRCGNKDVTGSLFGNVKYWKSKMVPIPRPSEEKLKEARKYLPANNPVGIVARNRTTYGRNLQPEFYVKLIKKLEDMDYSPFWFGEKQSTLACPVSHITDFSRMPESRDLELTLAIVSQLKFTVQFWTASTRLASIVGTPFLLFESPDQLFGQGQEAYRMALTTIGKKKLILSHFLNVYNDNDAAIDLFEKCVHEMEVDNWEDVIGMVDEVEIVRMQREQNLYRLAEI